ncbi:DUF1295 domain-containing protein [Glycomyces sp. A-F 0318]|uniref:DUF1295 domain-containing protein n=1 Tax=Glycomyces amatae TaxID=2881355 RepID=UPI001E379319|nr:DUF1295 domain-containing protein [Glycomyces amatae]MCD0447482.1 DUF1295 domain-containing protein [Glycomyces amatae]
MTGWGALGANLAATAGAALAVMLAAFAIGATRRRHRVVDVAWGLVFAAVALVTLAMSQGEGDPLRRGLVTAMALAWGLRLSLHLLARNWGEPEDRRYDAMLAKASGGRNAYAFRKVYLLQAGAGWFVSLPVQFAQYDPSPPGPLFWAGAALWTMGLLFEAVGDAQLAAFRRDPANRGKVLDAGLWRYTRHPNYFGDACVWWGLYLTACGTWAGAATALSAAVMTYFLAAKTGKPLLESHLAETRPGYDEYVRRTSGFVPLPPRR